MQQSNDRKVHAILLGASGAGKTILKQRLFTPNFSLYSVPIYSSTVGIDHKTAGQLVLWDTSGAKRHQIITNSYILRKSIVIFVFNDRASFNDLQHLISNAYEINPDIKKCLLIDMQRDNASTEVASDEAEDYANKNNMTYFKISIRENQSIELIEDHLAHLTHELGAIPANFDHSIRIYTMPLPQERNGMFRFFDNQAITTLISGLWQSGKNVKP